MADVFLIIVAVVIAVCILIGVLMMYTYFGNPDDKEEHLLPKIIVVREAKNVGVMNLASASPGVGVRV